MGIVEHCLRQSRLSSIDMGDDAEGKFIFFHIRAPPLIILEALYGDIHLIPCI